MADRDGHLKVVGTGDTLRENSTSLGELKRSLAAAEEAGAEVEKLDLNEPRLPMYETAAANGAMVHVVHSLWGIVVDLAEKIGVDERVGALA